MGWLYQKISDFFVEDDGSYPEICVCNLSPTQISNGYKLIRKISSFTIGKPRIFCLEEEKEKELDEVENASELVTSGKAKPFHFMVRNLYFGKDQKIPEIGVFILSNAIALDYEKGRVWGELEIESLLKLALKLMVDSPEAYVKLEEGVKDSDKERFSQALAQLKEESPDL